jgi:hypothetical protein
MELSHPGVSPPLPYLPTVPGHGVPGPRTLPILYKGYIGRMKQRKVLIGNRIVIRIGVTPRTFRGNRKTRDRLRISPTSPRDEWRGIREGKHDTEVHDKLDTR